jgi:NitT/TauT family transport system substrate-binding protein
MIKKSLAALLALALCFSMTACGSTTSTSTPAEESSDSEAVESTPETTEEPVTIRLAGLKGPTTIGMVKLLKDVEDGTSALDCEFTLAGAADEITPKLVQGELDIAAVPANLASVLYNNTNGAVELLAINTLGVIYIVETGDEVTSVESLRGKTVYATGKGSTPEYALRYILQENGLDPDNDVTIEWKSEATEVVAALSNGGGIAMLPQPYVTVAQGSVEGLHIALDLTEEWDKLDNGSMLITGVLAVRREFAENYPQQLAEFLEEYKASTEYANTNVEETAQLVEDIGIIKAAVASKAIPYCNIAFYEGDEMKAAMQGYLQVLYDQNPASVGGTLPADDFYYAR